MERNAFRLLINLSDMTSWIKLLCCKMPLNTDKPLSRLNRYNGDADRSRLIWDCLSATAKSTEKVINVQARKQPVNDFVKRWVYSCWRNVDNDSSDVTSAGRSFQIRRPTTGKARLATVVNLTGGTTGRLVQEERRARRPGRSATRSSGPRYCDAEDVDVNGWLL